MKKAIPLILVLSLIGSLTALALTPDEACDDLLEIGTNQVNSRNTRLQDEGQRILDAYQVLCVGGGVVTTTTTTTTTQPPSAGDFTCNTMLSMSQGGQVWRGGIEPNSEWEGQIRGGALLYRWANRNFDGYQREIQSECTDRSERRIVFLFDPARSDWPGDVYEAIDAIQFHNPDADQIMLVLLLGVDGHTVCPNDGKITTRKHNLFINRRDEVNLSQYNGFVVWGPDLHVANCSYFIDSIGHLNDAGEIHAGNRLLNLLGE